MPTLASLGWQGTGSDADRDEQGEPIVRMTVEDKRASSNGISTMNSVACLAPYHSGTHSARPSADSSLSSPWTHASFTHGASSTSSPSIQTDTTLAASRSSARSPYGSGTYSPYGSGTYYEWFEPLHVHISWGRRNATNEKQIAGHLNEQPERFAKEIIRLWELLEVMMTSLSTPTHSRMRG